MTSQKHDPISHGSQLPSDSSLHSIKELRLGVVMHTCGPSTGVAEVEEQKSQLLSYFGSSRSAWATGDTTHTYNDRLGEKEWEGRRRKRERSLELM